MTDDRLAEILRFLEDPRQRYSGNESGLRDRARELAAEVLRLRADNHALARAAGTGEVRVAQSRAMLAAATTASDALLAVITNLEHELADARAALERALARARELEAAEVAASAG